ncbi:MAG: TetR/AcrR family transcriptional regulator [Spirochaetales bacterium]|nr:TetR/AcrR family transcriptional regulator [Spirochaetales bacterium]
MGRIKDIQRKNIVTHAEKVFLDKGMFDTVMGEIAEQAGITRRTIYRYFETREDLAFEVMNNKMEEWNEYQHSVYRDLEGKGIEKLEHFLYRLIRYMEERREFLAFAGEFDFYFKGNPPRDLNSEIRDRYFSIIHNSEDILMKIVTEGVEDGSIRLEDDLELTVFTISNVLWSFGQRLGIMAVGLKKEFGRDPIEFIYCQLKMYTRGLSGS